jgi:hypothetical protein
VSARTLREVPVVGYNISLPEAGLNWEKMGPLFERYSIALVGSVNPRWAEAYKKVVGTVPGLSRFRLATDHVSVSFTCRSTDGPVEVMGVLKILEGVIQRVNREASLAAANGPNENEAGVAETGDSNGRSRVGGLFGRSAGHSK